MNRKDLENRLKGSIYTKDDIAKMDNETLEDVVRQFETFKLVMEVNPIASQLDIAKNIINDK